MKNPLVEKFGEQIRWVNWRLEERKGKKTKIPYRPGSARMASSTDAKTWGTYKEALEADSKHVGIVFTPQRTLLGIDIDHCIDTTGEGKSWRWADPAFKFLREVLQQANTYTEISPSGTGLHLYFELSEPLELEANRHGNYECYTDGRYFTFTGVPFNKMRAVRTITPTEALEILALLGYPWRNTTTYKNTLHGNPVLSKESLAAAMGTLGIDTERLEFFDKKPTPKIKSIKSSDASHLFEKMFSAANGAEIEKLYNGDLSSYKDDASRGDAAFLAHLAFWAQKDPALMESMWLASPIGKRKKTIDRDDYRKRSISAAIARCNEVYNPDLKGTSDTTLEDLGLLYFLKEKAKIYYKNTENISRVINNHPEFKNTFRFDTYRGVIERRIVSTWRTLEDYDAVDIQTKISVLFSDFAHVSKEMVYDAIIKTARDNQIDSAADYIKSLTWDGIARIDTWLTDVYGTPKDNYHKTIGANWLKGLVKRIMRPGCKFDYVLVLEGKQGIKKSMSLDVLGGELGHVETTISTEQKDFFLLMQGNAIIEFSEGETLSRAETKQLKSVISTQVDKYREPYGRATTSHPRRSVFAMTTNQSEYLKDETGNRRWLPVAVMKVANVEWLAENRDQLFAEAYHRVITKDETIHEFPENELEKAQTERRVKDPNSDTIINWYWLQPQSSRENGFTTADVWIGALHGGFSTRPMNRNEEMSIGDVLRTWLRLEAKQVMLMGVRARRFIPTEGTLAIQPSPENMPQRSVF